MRKMLADEPLNENDSCIVNDHLYYKLSGARKKMKVGRNMVLTYVNDGEIEVFDHPTLGLLFSPAAIAEWERKLTIKKPRRKN